MIAKCFIIGSKSVGKTQLTKVFNKPNSFEDQYRPTVGLDFQLKDYSFNQENYSLQVWDTSGDDKFNQFNGRFYKNTDFFILAFDLTNQQSFNDIKLWLEKINKNYLHDTYREDPVILLVGTKNDLTDQIAVTDEQVKNEHPHLPFIKTSAKTGEGLDEVFKTGLMLRYQHEQNINQVRTGSQHLQVFGCSFDTLRHVMSHPAAQIICILLLLAGLAVLGLGIAALVTGAVVGTGVAIAGIATGGSVALLSGVSFSIGLFPPAKKENAAASNEYLELNNI